MFLFTLPAGISRPADSTGRPTNGGTTRWCWAPTTTNDCPTAAAGQRTSYAGPTDVSPRPTDVGPGPASDSGPRCPGR